MSLNRTNIAWTDFTWNPVTGCDPISEGCKNCYAEKTSKRFSSLFGNFDNNHFEVTTHFYRLMSPLKRKKPAKIFVCSMGDLFHEDVSEDFIREVWIRMSWSSHHIFQILTKRPQRMNYLINRFQNNKTCVGINLPLPNVWLGVTCENQATADERIPLLLQTPAAVRFVSAEPLLGPIDFSEQLGSTEQSKTMPNGWHGIDWIIAGGETGPGARECREEWIKSIYDQCQSANVPFFFKQKGKKWYGLCEGIQCPPCIESGNDFYCDGEGIAWENRREWPK